MEASLSLSKIRLVPHPTMIWLGTVGLAFFLGAAAANGYTTHGAVQAVEQQVKGDCHYQLRQEHLRHVKPPQLRNSLPQ